jgi:hypothetical protein
MPESSWQGVIDKSNCVILYQEVVFQLWVLDNSGEPVAKSIV